MRHVVNHQVVLSQAPDGPLATWLDRFADAASRQGYTRSSNLSTDSVGRRFQPMARARRGSA